ncbi:helix-turn-helix transcriptional regulator [Shewanella sp. Choline-02u-19]|jgi:DNA-binding NarL/FixJ family response regulator|uniref:helix-turn-helix transcriptional regulator n=1 Tax=unclassified Shewanella TaxID=196818 RepID=UPI000C336619|nr:MULTISPECIES: response regulator transcription factor [unclassified Shewanella]PKG56968.1 helix-turn-helix transcriptional regulator [Shewanella sp. GutDb-MelDb]PKG72613.1 helix-turn-helix transcriptional regulator [Shewanella sp. GutCb]PKH57008.1 helix-turn-helix transcriptional regulator [Shewanella sp. Bg11-22]PKI27805.1 helix-turn-helix transcriptional regulator [Shewanella sp. Choline-02u-19]
MFKVMHWVIVTRSQILVDLLNTRWPQQFLVKIHNVIPDNVIDYFTENRVSLVIIDLSSVDIPKAYQIQRRLDKERSGARVVFLHYPQQVDAKFLVQSNITAGLFYSGASLDTIGLGMAKIVQGLTCIPDDFNQQDVHNVSTDEESDALTIREREVLQVLRSGSTNIDIANQLFVSESTIKTHLYRAFRKIGVSSRGQAIAWAQMNTHEVIQ